jgi:hypothetical protein
MHNLNGSEDFVNNILSWAEEMERRGLYDISTSKNLRTALKALVTVLDASESRDPKHLVADMESVAERWARANRANPTTMKTYRQRATSLVEDYIGYMESPASFKGRGGTNSSKKEERRPAVPQSKPTAPSTPDAAVALMNTFRLPSGKVFRYSLPEDFTSDDLRRIVYHFLPATIDFDPMRPNSFPSVAPLLENPPLVQ